MLKEQKYVEKFENSDNNPLEISGVSIFDKWNRNNSRIIIDKTSKKIENFNSILRIKIALEIYRIIIKENELILLNDDIIINHLRRLVEKSPFLKRLNYLLKDNDYSPILVNYIKLIIFVVKQIIKDPDKSAFSIGKKTGLKRDTVQELINEIKKNE